MPKEKFQRAKPKMTGKELLDGIVCPSTPAREKMREATFEKMQRIEERLKNEIETRETSEAK
ncbi:MAG: hypothetical protein IJN50_01065 [Clostridia bacterium]|nr:hypothetical protein [Clostridia bacterium]